MTKKVTTNNKASTPEPPVKAKAKATGRPFKKGRVKTGGRKLGTKNKYGNIRDRLRNIIEPYLNPDSTMKHTLADDLMRIEDPKDRADTVSKFMPFVAAKYSAVQFGTDNERPVTEENRLLELDNKYKKSEVEIKMKSITVVDNDNEGKETSLDPKDFGI